MIGLLVLMIAGVVVVGVVGAFLLYVSVLSILTAAVITGLLGTLFFGYWAGFRAHELPRSVARPALDSAAARTGPGRI